MKTHHFFLFLMSIALSATLTAQVQRDSLSGAQHRHAFTDQNGDGIKDTRGRKIRAMDRFVDRDGDGICDHRAQGFGFRRGMADSGKKMHIQGQGKKK
ncbi:MAG: hypothetical protein NTV54_02355 [Ignavibacteriales bacterium]|nr:hypothetical protein [Ignavibacteriales bacterium]